MGLVCTIKADINRLTAFQRFYNDSIIALLPLFNNYYSVIYSCSLENYERLLNMQNEEFINHLNFIFNKKS